MYTIRQERLTPEAYIGFLRRTDLGSQYPKERFHERIATLLQKASISLTARDEQGGLIGVCFGITDFAYWLFITDLGVVRDCTGMGIGTALVKAVLDQYPHVYQIELATDNTEKTVSFYKSLGFRPMEEIGCCGFLKMGQF